VAFAGTWLSSSGLWVGCSELLLQHHDNRIVPGVMEILLSGCNVDPLARPATVGVGRCMQGLMDVASEMVFGPVKYGRNRLASFLLLGLELLAVGLDEVAQFVYMRQEPFPLLDVKSDRKPA
jgi:hypothetical protein